MQQFTGVSAGSALGHCVEDVGGGGLTGQSGGVCNVIYTGIPAEGYTCKHGVVLDHVIYCTATSDAVKQTCNQQFEHTANWSYSLMVTRQALCKCVMWWSAERKTAVAVLEHGDGCWVGTLNRGTPDCICTGTLHRSLNEVLRAKGRVDKVAETCSGLTVFYNIRYLNTFVGFAPISGKNTLLQL
jgi:hypothetical protein